jgi:hypothetical protein
LVPKPVPAPAPDPKPIGDKAADPGADTGSNSGATTGGGGGGTTGGAGGGSSSGAGSSGTGLGPTLIGEPRGAEFASANPNASSTSYSGASPLLPEANAGDPNIRSLLIAGGQRNEAISPVGDDTAGSVMGLIVLGTLASLMLYGSAAYLKFGKRRPVTAGKHKA